MDRHLAKKRVVSGVVFWAPSDQSAVQQGDGPFDRGLNPTGLNLRGRAFEQAYDERGHGRDEAENTSGGPLNSYLFNIKQPQDFPRMLDGIEWEPCSGSQSSTRRCLPMLSVSIDVSVDGTVACTDLTQKFINPSDTLIPEALHSFPLYRGAVVTAFDCFIGDERHLCGHVKPTQLAKDEFNRAKTSRKRQAAALLEEATPEMFETTLGNIPPHAIVTVKLKYAHELGVVVMKDEKAEGLAIILPSSIAPRYEGSTSYSSHYGSKSAKGGLWVNIRVADSGILNAERYHIESGHDASYRGTEPMPKQVVIGGITEVLMLQAQPPETPRMQSVWCYTSASPVLKKDFVLVIQMRPESLIHSRAVVEPADSRGLAAMMVSLRPSDLFSIPAQPHEFAGELLFLLDQSGSMGFAANRESTLKIDTMRDAMHLALPDLPDTCAFNVISFGSEVRGMWPQSRLASNSDSIGSARAYLANIEANMNGTEVFQALKAATTSRGRSQGSTQIILITDGEVYEPKLRILEFVLKTRRQLGDKVRFFTLGIGDDVSHDVMESIAELGGGYCDVVDVVKQPDWKGRLNRMIRLAMGPTSWSCEVSLGSDYRNQSLATSEFGQSPSKPANVPYIQAPCPIQPLQPYKYKSIFFLLDTRGGETPQNVTITTTAPGAERREYSMDIEYCNFNTGTIHHLAVKAALASLGNEIEGAAKKIDIKRFNTARANAEYLGTQYAIASKWTSFVAVEDEAEEAVNVYSPLVQELAMDELLRFQSDSTSSDESGSTLGGTGGQDGDFFDNDSGVRVLQYKRGGPRSGYRLGMNYQRKSAYVDFNDPSSPSDTESVTSSTHQSALEEEHTLFTWLPPFRCQRDGLFVLDEVLRATLQGDLCAGAAARLDERLKKLARSHVLGDEAVAMIADTLMVVSYIETHLAPQRDSWHPLTAEAERGVLLLLGFGEDEAKMLVPLRDMLMQSIAHVHFSKAIGNAAVERYGGDGREATMKTCPVCDLDFDAKAWLECGDTAFVCRHDDCYNELPRGRRQFDNWDVFWEHQVNSGHPCCL